MQIRTMEKQPPPVAVIAPGKVYRRDSDVTHTPMFTQVEGLLVDEGVTLGDLKGTLTSFAHQIFGRKTKVRFRPSFFPFTEPSAEVDIQWRDLRWKRMPDLLADRVDRDPGLGAWWIPPSTGSWTTTRRRVSGFAFGMGIERIAMLKYGIDDIQLFFRNDMRFLRQF